MFGLGGSLECAGLSHFRMDVEPSQGSPPRGTGWTARERQTQLGGFQTDLLDDAGARSCRDVCLPLHRVLEKGNHRRVDPSGG